MLELYWVPTLWTYISSCAILTTTLRKEITSILHTHAHKCKLRDSGHIQEKLLTDSKDCFSYMALLPPFHLFLVSDLWIRNNSHNVSLYYIFYQQIKKKNRTSKLWIHLSSKSARQKDDLCGSVSCARLLIWLRLWDQSPTLGSRVGMEPA